MHSCLMALYVPLRAGYFSTADPQWEAKSELTPSMVSLLLPTSIFRRWTSPLGCFESDLSGGKPLNPTFFCMRLFVPALQLTISLGALAGPFRLIGTDRPRTTR